MKCCKYCGENNQDLLYKQNRQLGIMIFNICKKCRYNSIWCNKCNKGFVVPNDYNGHNCYKVCKYCGEDNEDNLLKNNKGIWSLCNSCNLKIQNDPKTIKKKSESALNYWKIPDNVEKQSERMKIVAKRPEYKERLGKSLTKFWRNVEERKKQSCRIKKFWNNFERKKHGEKISRVFEQPETKKRLSMASTISNNRPEVKLKQRIAQQKRILKNGGCKIGNFEKEIIDQQEKIYGTKFTRQYQVVGYFIDGYCPKLNLAIEVDEVYHKKRKNEDLIREENIKKALPGIKFIRIKTYL